MSDYLTILAARALQAAPVVRPRVASRFEAPQASHRFFSDNTTRAEAESFHESTVPASPPGTIAPSEPDLRARLKRNDQETSPPQSLPSLEQPGMNAMQSTLTPRETHAGNVSPINPLRTLEQPVAKELPNAPSLSESHIATNSPIVVESVIERPAANDSVTRYDALEPVDSSFLDQSGVSRDDAEDASDRGTIHDDFGLEPRPFPVPPLQTEPPSHLAVKTKSSGPLIAIPRLTPFPSPSQFLDRPAAAPEAAQTIHVTIGRVEVRAILPSAPAPPRASPARASSLLSLDEYLKRRTEGRT